MGITESNAPGKLILCGEHAVVYGCPAIAVPLDGVRAQVSIADSAAGNGIRLAATDLKREWMVDENTNDPLGELVFSTLRCLSLPATNLSITITSNIPIASGMGSGAAVSTALVHALTKHLGQQLKPLEVSELVYSCEKRYHGTPSGIDNTVIAFEQPIWFERGSDGKPTIEPLKLAKPFHLVIGDTGVRSKTRLPVAEVRRRWEHDPSRHEDIFHQVSTIVTQVRETLTSGNIETLGTLLNQNQALLEEMGVSSPSLEKLIGAARDAGAQGAKLSGAGWGGVMIALVDDRSRASVKKAIKRAGATQVMQTTVYAT